MATLEEMASSDTSCRTNGLYERFQGKTVLDLFLAQEVMMGLEGLSASLQGSRKTFGGVVCVFQSVKNTFSQKKQKEAFSKVFNMQVKFSCFSILKKKEI